MPTALLDLCDSNLRLWHGDTQLQSPGYALLEGAQYRFGQAAREAARLQPRHINTRYWWQLSTETLQPAIGPARHTADLVHAHLQNLYREGGEPGEVVLAVPGSMRRDQLSLLLGIVQQCPFDAVGLVNRSVALASLRGSTERLYHLEMQLHQALLSELSCAGGEVELKQTTPLPGCGLLQLQEKLVEYIAGAFIRQTRFDPRRKAETEQLLYNRLPEVLHRLGPESEANVEVNGYQARVNRTELAGATAQLAEAARRAMEAPDAGYRIIADPLVGLLPDLGQHLAGVALLDSGDLRSAVDLQLPQLLQRGEALSLVTTLPLLAGAHAEPGEDPEPPARASTPTHILRDGQARPLDGSPIDLGGNCELFLAGQHWQLRGGDAQVNDRQYQPGQALAAGDRISPAAGSDWLLIEVLPDGR